MRTIYLDNNATTPVAASVQQAMLPFLSQHYGDPSSGHSLGRACYEAMEDARSQVAGLIGADREEIVFTASGSESDNLAIKGVLLRQKPAAGGHLVISAIEHAAVSQSAYFLERLGYDVTVVGCDRLGVVNPSSIEVALRPDTVLVSVVHANHEIGTIQPLRAIAELCHARGVLVHTDAAQTVGKIRVNIDELDVDLISMSGHKVYAPKGIGALYVRGGVALEPLIHGADHEGGLRAGTENVPHIVGFGKACALAAKSMDDTAARMETLRDRLLNNIRLVVGSKLIVHGEGETRLPNTLCLSFPGVTGASLLARIPELCASTGATCKSGTSGMSPTLAALRCSPEVASGTIRLSTGWYTSEDDVDRAANLLLDAWEQLR